MTPSSVQARTRGLCSGQQQLRHQPESMEMTPRAASVCDSGGWRADGITTVHSCEEAEHRTPTPVCVCVCLCVCARACVCGACACACACECVCARVRVVRARVRACACACMCVRASEDTGHQVHRFKLRTGSLQKHCPSRCEPGPGQAGPAPARAGLVAPPAPSPSPHCWPNWPGGS